MTDELATHHVDIRLAALAARQHGVAAARQLLALGLTRDQIHHRVRTGRLHRLSRGVYAVGHAALRWEGHVFAALLGAGDDAVLSHASAAAWWDIRPRPSGNVHVTIPRDTGRSRRHGVTIHRARALRPQEVTVHRGLRVTTVARTLLDHAGTSPRHFASRAVEAALSRRLLDDAVHDVLAAHPRAPGGRTLRALLSEHGDTPGWTQSDFEAFIVELCRVHRLPRPQTNVPVLGEVVDAYWPDHGVVAEPDGLDTHGTRAAAHRDRTKDAERMRHGIITVRITYQQAQQDGRRVAAAIRGAMRR